MSTTSSSPTPAPKPDNSKQRIIAIAAVIIVALLGVNAFLLVSKMKDSKENTELNAQLDESEQLKAELEEQYYEALGELEEMRGSNEELNALIDQQKEELTSQKDRIATLLKDKNELGNARKEMKRLSAKVEQYLAEINQLREENEQLVANNSQLSEENASLSNNLDEKLQENQELSEVKAELVSEKENLEADKAALSAKVVEASVVKVNEIEVKGYKIKSSGKTYRRRKAENVEQLQICFDTQVNDVAEPGSEEFHLRIIDPSGQTMAVEGLGSGVMKKADDGQEVRFTSLKEISYNQDAKTVCMAWTPGIPFKEGDYKVEIYNKGHLSGKGEFSLR
jgi:myosin heavy subunit